MYNHNVTVCFSKDEINALRLIMDSEIEENKNEMERYRELFQTVQSNTNESTIYKMMADGYQAQYEFAQRIVRKINDAFAKGK